MPTNFYIYFLTALIPLAVGAAWYHPALFGNKWMKMNGFTEESLQETNMVPIFAATYFFGILLSFFFTSVVVHQQGLMSLLIPEAMESDSQILNLQNHLNELMGMYGDRFRTFGHGVVHGIITTIFFVLPVIAFNALFERRGWGYIFLHVGYWMIVLVLIGGVLSKFLVYGTMS